MLKTLYTSYVPVANYRVQLKPSPSKKSKGRKLLNPHRLVSQLLRLRRSSMRSRSTSFCDPPPPSAASLLVPGFRFHPTDEELVSYYLKRKVLGLSLRADAIAEVDIYNCEPWDLPCRSRIRSRDLEWYFFSPLDRKHSSRSRTNRVTPKGYWKTTGKDRPVWSGAGIVGMKKTLVFHVGRAPRGTRSNWVMHEYRLEGERLAQIGISHDAYAVCRIFQKISAGPQNGAQYGAPFLEEEWEEEENANCGVLLMSNSGVDKFNETMKEEHLQSNHSLQTEDSDKHVNEPSVVTELGENDYTGLPDERFDDPCLTSNKIESIDEPGKKSNPTPFDDMEKKPLIGGCIHSPSHLNQMDKHMECNEIKEFVSGPVRNFHAEDVGVERNSSSQEMSYANEFVGIISSNPNQPERLSPQEDNYYIQPKGLHSLAGGCTSNQEHQGKIVFYDAPSDDFKFRFDDTIKMNGPLYLSNHDSSSLDMVDDLLMYFDATDSDLHYNIMGASENSECNYSSDHFNSARQVDGGNNPTSRITLQVADADTVVGTSSASSLPYNQPEGKHEENTVKSVQRTNADERTVAKLLQNILGSIPASPAFADELQAGSGKSLSQIAATHSAGSIPVPAGFIDISGVLSVSRNAGQWSLLKNGHAIALSYGMEANRVRKHAAPELTTTNLVDAVSKVLQVCLYLIFFSTLFFTLGCKLVKRMFMAGKKVFYLARSEHSIL
ncbi:NAC domain-containing protein [Canna indica]|uniref:NAC domain-containing protein n=1 Tax=Canna indica TaxID=4628 RepID=A0AAQ3KH66_9LILI|nr:NAC domain-containing protein [Canna indica]